MDYLAYGDILKDRDKYAMHFRVDVVADGGQDNRRLCGTFWGMTTTNAPDVDCHRCLRRLESASDAERGTDG